MGGNMDTKVKKIGAVSWEEIIIEAMTALTDGRSDVDVPADEMYRWIESTEYLTEWVGLLIPLGPKANTRVTELRYN
jgi:hypothetical protein